MTHFDDLADFVKASVEHELPLLEVVTSVQQRDGAPALVTICELGGLHWEARIRLPSSSREATALRFTIADMVAQRLAHDYASTN